MSLQHVYIKTALNGQLLSDSLFENRTDFLSSDEVVIVMDKSVYSKDDTITFYLENKLQVYYTFGEEYWIEMLHKDEWKYVSIDGVVELWDLVLWILKPEGKTEAFGINLSEKYSKLRNGTYKLYKEITDLDKNTYVIYTEFQIK